MNFCEETCDVSSFVPRRILWLGRRRYSALGFSQNGMCRFFRPQTWSVVCVFFFSFLASSSSIIAFVATKQLLHVGNTHHTVRRQICCLSRATKEHTHTPPRSAGRKTVQLDRFVQMETGSAELSSFAKGDD